MVQKVYVTYNDHRAAPVSEPLAFGGSRSRLDGGLGSLVIAERGSSRAAKTDPVNANYNCAPQPGNQSLTTVCLLPPQVHKLCQQSADKLLADFQPQLMIAIGGGGYVPARILRSFLKKSGSPNIPIQAIGLSLYESLGNEGDGQVETVGTKVTRTQWLDLSSLGEMANLVGKRILIVDEVDDTRTTLEYAVKELEKDVEAARQRLGGDQPDTEFSIFVLHNKDKPKKGVLPHDMVASGRYHAARTVGDEWICYPWEATDIDEHDRLAEEQGNTL